MTATTTVLKAATITTVLKKAGFNHSEFLASSRVRGWGSSTAGFETESEYTSEWKYSKQYHYTQKRGSHKRMVGKEIKTYTGRVFVKYQQSTNISATYDPAITQQKLDAMAKVLTEQGYKVEREEQRLIVERAN